MVSFELFLVRPVFFFLFFSGRGLEEKLGERCVVILPVYVLSWHFAIHARAILFLSTSLKRFFATGEFCHVLVTRWPSGKVGYVYLVPL